MGRFRHSFWRYIPSTDERQSFFKFVESFETGLFQDGITKTIDENKLKTWLSNPEKYQKELENLDISEFDFRQNMKNELSKYFTDAYASNGERLKVTSVRISKSKAV